MNISEAKAWLLAEEAKISSGVHQEVSDVINRLEEEVTRLKSLMGYAPSQTVGAQSTTQTGVIAEVETAVEGEFDKIEAIGEDALAGTEAIVTGVADLTHIGSAPTTEPATTETAATETTTAPAETSAVSQ